MGAGALSEVFIRTARGFLKLPLAVQSQNTQGHFAPTATQSAPPGGPFLLGLHLHRDAQLLCLGQGLSQPSHRPAAGLPP